MQFVNCSWTSNNALSGAAVDMTVHFYSNKKNGVFIQPQFIDCAFTNNCIWLNENSLESGVFFVMTVDIMFVGNITFFGNNGSAIAAVDSVLNFNTTSAVFHRNIGLNGGAISLLNVAYINLYPGSNVNFSSNIAKGEGGAIYSQVTSGHQLRTSSACPIRYSEEHHLPPSNWSTQIVFEDNQSLNGKKSNSLYMSSLLPCQLVYSSQKYCIRNKSCNF